MVSLNREAEKDDLILVPFNCTATELRTIESLPKTLQDSYITRIGGHAHSIQYYLALPKGTREQIFRKALGGV